MSNFEWALEQLRKDKKVKRKSLPASWFVEYREGYPLLLVKFRDGSTGAGLLNAEDILADDWSISDNETN